MKNELELDGSQGEGGGQVLRSALSLSMCTGQPFRITNIRVKRKTPGLMRQHLTALQAAAAVCRAEVEGGQVGSMAVRFKPGRIQGGDYRFAIGTAGSCTLVFQTLLPALLQAEAPSQITLHGGTHNPFSPPFHFLERAFLPLLRRMGAEVTLVLQRYGFYPAGGGEFTAHIKPGKLSGLGLENKGDRIQAYAESFIAGIPSHIAQRELDVVRKRMGWNDGQLILRGLPKDQGPGNALMLTVEQENVTEVLTGFGEKRVTAEAVAERTVEQLRRYLASRAAVGPYLADQLLLPLALAGGGSFTTSSLSLHTQTNAEIIQRFLNVRFAITTITENLHRVVCCNTTDSN